MAEIPLPSALSQKLPLPTLQKACSLNSWLVSDPIEKKDHPLFLGLLLISASCRRFRVLSLFFFDIVRTSPKGFPRAPQMPLPAPSLSWFYKAKIVTRAAASQAEDLASAKMALSNRRQEACTCLRLARPGPRCGTLK